MATKLPEKAARAITRFVEDPITKLLKGIALLGIGLSEASRTLSADLVNKQLRVGHGLIIIGIFGILESLPHLVDGLAEGGRFLQRRGERTGRGPDTRAER
jgi:hypothetical protein